MEPAEQDLTRFGDRVRDALDAEEPAAAVLRAGRARLLAHVTTHEPPAARRPLRRRLVVTSALATAGAAALWALLWLRQPISFEVGDRPGHVGDRIEASEVASTGVRFSEGSAILLERGARLRVLSTEPGGARVLLEKGPLDVAIVHQRHRATRWRFEAGPLAVRVTGTRFRLSWNEAEQVFALNMREGSVVVSGPCLPGTRALGAGEELRISCRPTTEASWRPAPLVVPAPRPAPADPATPAAALAEPGDDGGEWRALLAAGRFVGALRAAQRLGFARIYATADETELLALADAARLSGRTGRAVEVLGVLRARFPRTSSASTAAFALGRIAFERRADYVDAAHWFATYLDEAPGGPLMGDAAGRLVEAWYRAGDRSDARREAERYLRRFPRGPYARTAAEILSE
jgi:transmembrane sensor